MEYDIDEARFELFAPMVDISANTLEVDLPNGGVMRVYVARKPREDGDLASHVRERIVDLRRQLPEFESTPEAPLEIDGKPAIEARFRYRDGQTPLYHRALAFFVAKKLVMLGIVAPAGENELADRTFESLLKSLVIEDRSAPH